MGKTLKNFSEINLQKIKQLRPFKINYSRVKILELRDNDKDLKLLDQKAYLKLKAINVDILKSLAIWGRSRPTFSEDLRYLQSYSSLHYPKGKVAVVVNSSIYDEVRGSIHQYVLDLANDGYFGQIYTVNGASPSGLKNLLKNIVGLKGAVFVGDVPVAWYRLVNDFYGDTTEFPCDLYYMDLNGTWSDPDGNGVFDSNSGNVQPEIWVSRVWTPTLGGNSVQLINDYFSRNHSFRIGQLGVYRSGLSLIDDDWEGFGDCGMDAMFPTVETITAPADTTATRYKSEINYTRGWATIGAHSSPNGHSFEKPGGSEWVPSSYLRDERTPKAHFYNLYACSNTRFTEPNYMGGWYIFDQSGGERCNGIAAVGSTKTGSMLAFENFYTPMGAGKVLGEAYKDWWISLGADHDLGEKRWYYGMVILGDPTVNWWSGGAPILNSPLNNSVFSHFPRTTHFNWTGISIPGVTYTIEIDAFGARNAGAWATETGEHWLVQSGISGTSFNHNFVGAQRGRWRVKANLGSINFPWS
ncbi:MAG: hypothetical protein ACRCVT_01850, partial [Leadbetterella sp.]